MHQSLLEHLRCPVTRSRLTLTVIKKGKKMLNNREVDIIQEGILFAAEDWFFPVVNGIPRLNIDAVIDHAAFFQLVLPDYAERKEKILLKYAYLVSSTQKKSKRTRQSFTKEWSLYDHEHDKTWDADAAGMLERFLKETDESLETLDGKIIFDAGCGNGTLNSLLAEKGITNIAMDFSDSVEGAFLRNSSASVHYIQGDVQFPPVAFNAFDIVHCSGVLIHTNNTELSFSCIEPTVKKGGKLSVWLYHRRNDFIHNLFNSIRKLTSKLPLGFQYYLYRITIFPVSFIVKRIKGNKQNSREMMIDILDWFTPEYRWEHDHEEAKTWFFKRGYMHVRVTTNELFGFNVTGEKA